MRSKAHVTVVVLVALLDLPGGSPAQALVRDIRAQPATYNPGSGMLDLTELNNTVLFGAYDQWRGGQIWSTDGTAGGTTPVTAFPTDNNFSFQLWTMVARNGYLVFPGGEPGDRELWRTDGTRTGTYRIADIRPGPLGSSPRYLTPLGNLVFFTCDDGVHGEELWRTDGTAAGTFMVADLDPGSLPHVFGLTALGSRLVFSATSGRDPWISDGTSAGTFRLRDINPSAPAWASQFREWNGVVYFHADDGVNGYELWRTDGTSAGTVLVADIAAGAASSFPQSFAVAGGRLFFSADDGVSGTELWSTDGTAAGTSLVRDIALGVAGSGVSSITSFANKVIMVASDGSGPEAWISDGTAAGTMRLGDLQPGPNGSAPHAFRVFANATRCAFRAATQATGREVFVTDGTPAGTRLLADILPGAADGVSGANNFTFGVIGNEIVFPATDPLHGEEPWISDGTSNGTRLLADVNAGVPQGSGVTFAGRIGDREFFRADDGTGAACWVTDGTTAGTTPAGFPSEAFSTPLAEFRDRSWYLARGAGNTELWSTDGTAAGTTRVAVVPGLNPFQAPLLVANDRILLISGNTLWSSDGTTAGTAAIFAFNVRPLFGVAPQLYTEYQGAAYLVAEHNGAVELWRTDGTSAGTVAITNFGQLGTVSNVRVSGGMLLFVATDPALGTELFVSNGTSAGTRVLADLQPGAGSSYPDELTPVDGGVFFTAQVAFTPQLWFTDTTQAGTHFVAALTSGQLPLGLSPFGSRVLFVGIDGAGREPWISDGTPAGTRRIANLRPGSPDSLAVARKQPSFTVVGSGRVALFAANDGDHGNETWRTDGTAAGSWRVTEIGPGPVSSNPRSWTRLGGKILFAASGMTVGEELYELRLVTTGDSLAAPRVRGCAGSLGVPVLQPIGVPSIGNAAFALRTSNAPANTIAALALGAPSRVSLGACTRATNYLLLVTFGLDQTGSATLGLPVPNVPSLFGGELDAQVLVVDPQGSYRNQISFTNDLLLVLGDQ